MREDNKNLLLAIVMSVVVLLGWQYYFTPPQRTQVPQAGPATSAPVPGAPSPSEAGGPSQPVPGTLPTPTGAPVTETREAALKRSARVTIDTPTKRGSISLRGARIDDVVLKNYTETVDRSSPNIVLFSPSGSPNPYYAEFGWVPAGNVPGGVPTFETVWTADRQSLSPGNPVTLTYDNGQGVTYRRVISVDDKSMFTVNDTVENRTGEPLSLYPFGLVSRHGRPHQGLDGRRGRLPRHHGQVLGRGRRA